MEILRILLTLYQSLLFSVLLLNRAIECNESISSQLNSPQTGADNHRQQQQQQSKLKYHDVWYEINESTILNCSLRVNKDQHVVWHRKYDKMGVHVLTIGSETFISDLRIRPIKQQYLSLPAASSIGVGGHNSSGLIDALAAVSSSDDYKLTWNLEIRRLRKDDTAFYYCVLNSENAYGQIYKLNVLSHLRFLNKSEIYLDEPAENDADWQTAAQEPHEITLVCIYDDIIKPPKDQIKWYFNKHRIRNSLDENSQHQQQHVTSPSSNIKILSRLAGDDDAAAAAATTHQQQFSSSFSPNHHFTITQSISEHKNTTQSVLTIHNFNLKYNYGRYRCQYKGLIKTVRIYPNRSDSSTRLLFKQSVLSVASSSSSASSSNTAMSSSIFSSRTYLRIFISFVYLLSYSGIAGV